MMKPYNDIAKLNEEATNKIKEGNQGIQDVRATTVRHRYAIRPATPYHNQRHGGMLMYVYVEGHEGIKYITNICW